MSGRKICCRQCGKDMGEIAEGSKLRKGMSYICEPCGISLDEQLKELRVLKLMSKMQGTGNPDFIDIFKDVFGKK